jgi:hypothetical protein
VVPFTSWRAGYVFDWPTPLGPTGELEAGRNTSVMPRTGEVRCPLCDDSDEVTWIICSSRSRPYVLVSLQVLEL